MEVCSPAVWAPLQSFSSRYGDSGVLFRKYPFAQYVCTGTDLMTYANWGSAGTMSAQFLVDTGAPTLEYTENYTNLVNSFENPECAEKPDLPSAPWIIDLRLSDDLTLFTHHGDQK